MKFKDELFNKYEIRKSKEQKTEFIDWVTEYACDRNWDVKVEQGSFGVRNIIIGDLDKAKILFTAHYDTCANMVIPNFITPRNFFIYLIYQLLLCFLIFIPVFVIVLTFDLLFPNLVGFSFILSYILTLIVLGLMMFGPANKHTANDNTSGVATILACLDKFNYKDNVAFILFDLEEVGLIGSSMFASKHKDISKNMLLVNYDCVSDGDTMLFVLNKKTKELVDSFKESYKSNDDVKTEVTYKAVFYPSDQACFKKGIGVCSMKKNKFFKSGYIDKIHTKNDTNFREENIKYLVEGSYKLYKSL